MHHLNDNPDCHLEISYDEELAHLILGTLVQAAEDSVMDEMHPLLRVQAAHVGHEGLVVVAQPLSLRRARVPAPRPPCYARKRPHVPETPITLVLPIAQINPSFSLARPTGRPHVAAGGD